MSNSTITYATLAELKAALKVPIDNTDYDLGLETALESVTKSIEDYCGRRFHSGIATSTAYLGALETRYYTAECDTELMVDDLLQLVTLRSDDNGNSSYDTTHSTALVYLTPFNATLDDRPYTGLCLRPNATAAFLTGVERGIQVIGVFGYCPTTAVNPTVRKAALLQAAMDFRSEDAPFGAGGGRDFTVEQSRAFGGAGLHPFMKRMLDPMRRRIVA